MDEKKLDEILKIENKFDSQINKKVKREMRKQIYSRVIIILIILSIVGQFVYRSASYFISITNYNPLAENKIVLNDENSHNRDIDVLMATYINMFFPGKLYCSGDCISLGFGSYELTAIIQNINQPLNVGKTNTTFSIQRSKLSIDSKDVFTRYTNEYYNDQLSDYENVFESISDSTIKNIQELPESTILDVAISFNHKLSLKETISFIKQYDKSKFVWLATHIENQVTYGMSLYDAQIYDLNSEAIKRYPHFYLSSVEDFTPEILVENYLSKLKLLIDNKEFLQLVFTEFPYNGDISFLEEQYNDIRKNGIQCIGTRAYVKKGDLLNMISNGSIRYLYIHDVKLSQFSKQ